MWQTILDNFFGGLAVFISGFGLGYVVKALGGISGIVSDVALLKTDVQNLKVQSPIVISAPAPTTT